jgi:hypothetical protein
MIHYSMYVNHGSIDYPDFDSTDPVVSDSIPGDDCNALLDYLQLGYGGTDYALYGDLIVTQSAVCSWSTV